MYAAMSLCPALNALTFDETWVLLGEHSRRVPGIDTSVPAESNSANEQADRQRAAWMAAAQAGDQHAYARLLNDSVGLIRAVARRQGVATDALDDVVQETLLTVHRVRHTFDPSRSYDAWLSAIAARRAIDVLRGQGRRDRREVHDELAYEHHADREDASAGTEREQEAMRLRKAIDTLPPGQREAVEQLGLKERSLAEAAEHTGRKTGALKVNLHRALKTLRDRLSGDT
jgi:RNA polymerase sigma factor (sigma-70 family)